MVAGYDCEMIAELIARKSLRSKERIQTPDVHCTYPGFFSCVVWSPFACNDPAGVSLLNTLETIF